MQSIQEQLRDACNDVGDDSIVSFRNNYSGRGMYGHECVGIDGSMAECMLVIGQVIKNMASSIAAAALDGNQDKLADVEHEFDQAVDMLLNFRQDSMGLGTILYWPELEPAEEEEPEYDGQPDEAQEWHDFDPDC